MAFQVLEKPESSSRDKKEYRAIKLENGLTALLIADQRIPLDLLEAEEKGSSSDGRNLKKSAAGLCVGIGGLSDPETDLPGLAHFLEHMVFMGSQKFEDESDFGFFIHDHGGSYNASTDYEATVFQFDIQRVHFKAGLDRLSQFFTAPLLKKEAMSREREAVDSEFLMAIQNDEFAKGALLGSLSKEGHPMRNFLWGNKESLCPDKLDDDAIHKILVDFKDRHYSSHYMTLVVQSQDTLDNLEKMVLELFSDVPNNELPRETFHHLKDPFNTEAFRKIYKVVPIENTYKLDMSWALEPLKAKYRVKPLKYLSSVIGDEGEGSLTSYLREKTLALDLSAGNSGYGFDNNSTGTIFSISVELTQKGFHELDSVIQAIYSYISMISAEGPSPRIYEEIQRMQQIDFDFGDEPQPLENVITLCEGMQILPSIRYLDGHRLLFEFDKEGLQTLTEESFLKNPNVNIMISAKEFKDSESENSVPWFKTKYIVEDISPERLTGWRKPLPEGFFKLSSENTFIPRNMDLISEEKSSPMIPSKMNVQGGELFYKRDESFGLPRAYAYFHFCTELIEKPEDAVCLDLMVDIINQQMKEDTYSACVAKLHFSLTSCEQGIVLKISGYNDRLSHLLSVIMSHITNFESLLNPERFLVIKAQTKKNYFNSFTKASNLVQDLRLSLLKFAYHGAQARHATIEFIDAEALCAFSRAFKAKTFIQALVQGNVSSAGAEELFQLASGIRSQNTESPKEIQCKEVPKGDKILRLPGILPTDNNTFVTNYYQFGLAKLVDQALFDLLAMMMDEPVFDVLRTKEQLGYYVFSLLRNTHGVFGIEVTVNSQENKFSVDHVEGRISAFLKRFYEEDICGMSQSKFEEYLGSLIKKKLTSDVTLEEEVRRNWKEITSKDYIFDRNSQEAALLQKNAVSLEDIKGMVKRLFIDPESMRKLSFQVVGVETKVESNSASLPLDKKYNMDLTTVPERKDVFVSDLCTFKENCTNYPVNHVN